MKNSSKIRFLVLALTLTMILSLVACGTVSYTHLTLPTKA